jgi:hypothetical protein
MEWRSGGRLFRRPKLTLSCSAEGKEGRINHFKLDRIRMVRFSKHVYKCCFNSPNMEAGEAQGIDADFLSEVRCSLLGLNTAFSCKGTDNFISEWENSLNRQDYVETCLCRREMSRRYNWKSSNKNISSPYFSDLHSMFHNTRPARTDPSEGSSELLQSQHATALQLRYHCPWWRHMGKRRYSSTILDFGTRWEWSASRPAASTAEREHPVSSGQEAG